MKEVLYWTQKKTFKTFCIVRCYNAAKILSEFQFFEIHQLPTLTSDSQCNIRNTYWNPSNGKFDIGTKEFQYIRRIL